MRITLCIVAVLLCFSSCQKNKYTTAPQIKFNSIKPNVAYNRTDQGPVVLSIQLTDKEGDFGFDNTDTTHMSYVYIKNISTPPNKFDSIRFPSAISSVNRKDLNAEVDVSLNDFLQSSDQPNRPYTDTLYFEVYVQDFAKHKSNVIKAGPVYYISP